MCCVLGRFYEMGEDVINKYIDTHCPQRRQKAEEEQTAAAEEEEMRRRRGRGRGEGGEISVRERVWKVFDKPDENTLPSRIVAGPPTHSFCSMIS